MDGNQLDPGNEAYQHAGKGIARLFLKSCLRFWCSIYMIMGYCWLAGAGHFREGFF
jgi:hypothetical protein